MPTTSTTTTAAPSTAGTAKPQRRCAASDSGVNNTTIRYTARNQRCMATAQPATSRTWPLSPTRISALITSSTNSEYTAVGPRVRATRARMRSWRDTPGCSSASRRAHETADA